MHARGINMRYLGLVRHQLFLNAVERLRADKHLYNKRKGKIISCTYRTMLFTEVFVSFFVLCSILSFLIYHLIKMLDGGQGVQSND